MQTGTFVSDNFNKNNKYTLTLILLCFGYFIDFYDLTIFSASYVNVFRDSFNIYDISHTQQLYLKISSFYTVGIFCGAIFFGVLGDKVGRTAMIRYSILLYSIAMILSIFTHSIAVFTFLRFVAGAGLAAEFATSSVLINELLPTKSASKYTSLLYFCGILGGMTATYFSSISWKFMYLFGGVAGFIIFIARKKIFESGLFLKLNDNISRGNILELFNNWVSVFKFCRLLLLIMPFNFLITIMFIYPRFMQLDGDLGDLTRVLLTGFFIGNLISTIACNIIISKFKDYRVFILVNIFIFLVAMPTFWLINGKWFFPYAIVLGLLGGGLPTAWIQLVIKSYGTNLRSTASNTLFAFGRLSGIGFNLIISVWLVAPKTFHIHVIFAVVGIVFLVLLALIRTPNNYIKNMEYIESKDLS
ncbi:MAG: MFS transporter [Proteobacteria bacterium]|jgi:MFS family permease|nr:MFS transporter [Pseudomonadota bacterium]